MTERPAGLNRDLPPGLHLQADVTLGSGADATRHQLRLLGDERRGYLLVGLAALPDGEDAEFWFATVEEAKQAAAEHGVRLEDWDDVRGVEDVRLGG
jgi:hypothetical protein